MSILEPGGTPGDTTDLFAVLPDQTLEDSNGVSVLFFPTLGMSLASNQGVTAAELEVDSGDVSRSISKCKVSEFIAETLFRGTETKISDLLTTPKTGIGAAGNPSHFTGHGGGPNLISFPTLLKQLHRIPPDLGENPSNNNYNNNTHSLLLSSSSAGYLSECYIEGDIMEHNGFTLKSYPVLIKLIQTPANRTPLEKASPRVESQEEQSSRGSSDCQNHASKNPLLVPAEPAGCSMQEKISSFQNRDSENRPGFPTLIEVDGLEYLARFRDLRAGYGRIGAGNELATDDAEQTQEGEESIPDPERHSLWDFQMKSQHPSVDPLGLPEERKTRSKTGVIWKTHSTAWEPLDEGILKKEGRKTSKQRPLNPRSFSQTTLPSPSPALAAPERPYFCFACEKRFRRATDLKEHLRVHTGERPFSCPVCCKAFTQASALATHRRIHTGEKPFQCRVCFKRFNSSSNFAKHRRTHSTTREGSPRYPCPFWRRTFREASHHARHLSRVHGGGGGGEEYAVTD
ncbi:ZN500 protein, partial [Polyodon spathula]|nr:zinc finger protein 768-like [Polyodon spathula]XP_041088230.1 zinc finger protein 768-like [Polyodon spathula]XP_041088231.1 zinc finger protein 768-like [Polyodon spathula]MBN3275098.1 ZN500 protein [Polyodon spathula]